MALLGSHMHNYTEQHYNYAIHVLKYGITSRHMGLIYSRGLDPHGLNEVYGYADSNFQAPRSTGGHTLMNNGAAFINTAKKHPTVDTSSTMAELSELFYCSLDVSIIHNFMEEIGMKILEPTLVYPVRRECGRCHCGWRSGVCGQWIPERLWPIQNWSRADGGLEE